MAALSLWWYGFNRLWQRGRGTWVCSRSAPLSSCVWNKYNPVDPASQQLTCLLHRPDTYGFLISKIKESQQAFRQEWRSRRWAERYFAKVFVVSFPSGHEIWKCEIHLRAHETLGVGEREGGDPHEYEVCHDLIQKTMAEWQIWEDETWVDTF